MRATLVMAAAYCSRASFVRVPCSYALRLHDRSSYHWQERELRGLFAQRGSLRQPPMLPTRTQRWTGFSALVFSLFACTLTSEEYEPQRIESLPQESPATGELAPAPPGPEEATVPAQPAPASPTGQSDERSNASCTSSGALPGCQLARQEPPPDGVECSSELDCSSRSCRAGRCIPASCSDGILNQGEVDTDCAGPCEARCAEAAHCSSSADCNVDLTCLATTLRCAQPSCVDGEQNGDESGRDCGGSCSACPAGSSCSRAEDCASGLCSVGLCAAASCNDQLQNQDETAIDCGGVCGPCAAGRACTLDGDCQSGACQDGACCGGQEADCTRCARRLASTLDCASNGASAAVSAVCDSFLQCLTEHPESCPRRQTSGCANAGGVCDVASYGGAGSAGISRADAIIGTAACNF